MIKLLIIWYQTFDSYLAHFQLLRVQKREKQYEIILHILKKKTIHALKVYL